jgi:protein-tyrosine phosphatase
MTAVALICTANRCRSVMAHAILADEVKRQSLPIEVYSAGVIDFSDAPPLSETTAMCLRFQTPAPDKPPTWVRSLPLDSITRFLVMEQHHANALVNSHGIEPNRISLLGEFDPKGRGVEILDPYACGEAAYKQCYEQLRDCIGEYLKTTEDLDRE